MKSRSEMKRLAAQKPEVLIKEIERLREENVRLLDGLECLYMGCAWSAFSPAKHDRWNVTSNGTRCKSVDEALNKARAALELAHAALEASTS